MKQKSRPFAGKAKAAGKKKLKGLTKKSKLGALKLAAWSLKHAKAKGGKLCPH